MDERDIEKVAEAFDRLLAHAARTCDQTVTWPIAAAKGDISKSWRANGIATRRPPVATTT